LLPEGYQEDSQFEEDLPEDLLCRLADNSAICPFTILKVQLALFPGELFRVSHRSVVLVRTVEADIETFQPLEG
jgi:hypothetical protein